MDAWYALVMNQFRTPPYPEVPVLVSPHVEAGLPGSSTIQPDTLVLDALAERLGLPQFTSVIAHGPDEVYSPLTGKFLRLGDTDPRPYPDKLDLSVIGDNALTIIVPTAPFMVGQHGLTKEAITAMQTLREQRARSHGYLSVFLGTMGTVPIAMTAIASQHPANSWTLPILYTAVIATNLRRLPGPEPLDSFRDFGPPLLVVPKERPAETV